MSQLHILEVNGDRVRVVAHVATPAGNNAASISWVNAVIGAGLNRTVLSEGTGAGQITTQEKTDVLAGTVLEMEFQFKIPSGNAANKAAALDAMFTKFSTQYLSDLQARLNYFGMTRG